jgi:hypothetical protein
MPSSRISSVITNNRSAATCLQQQNDQEQKTMNQTPAASESLLQSAAKRTRTLDWERLGFLYARIALGAAFLSGIADRFGLYWAERPAGGSRCKGHSSKYLEFGWLYSQAAYLLWPISCNGGCTGSKRNILSALRNAALNFNLLGGVSLEQAKKMAGEPE